VRADRRPRGRAYEARALRALRNPSSAQQAGRRARTHDHGVATRAAQGQRAVRGAGRAEAADALDVQSGLVAAVRHAQRGHRPEQLAGEHCAVLAHV